MKKMNLLYNGRPLILRWLQRYQQEAFEVNTSNDLSGVLISVVVSFFCALQEEKDVFFVLHRTLVS